VPCLFSVVLLKFRLYLRYTSLHRLIVLPERSLMEFYHLSEMHIAWLSTMSLPL